MNYGYQAFKGGATQVYTIDAKSGEMRLVRGVEIVGTPLSTLNKVVAASKPRGYLMDTVVQRVEMSPSVPLLQPCCWRKSRRSVLLAHRSEAPCWLPGNGDSEIE